MFIKNYNILPDDVVELIYIDFVSIHLSVEITNKVDIENITYKFYE